ncbi:MAG: hypothetical protein COA47_06995 [Robiginitomaculum sp.]|nr:MAG: hypothetical protein COA47_06995 [Robiginitomaculum sp.]
MRPDEKRLHRLLLKLVDHPQVLLPDGRDGYIGQIDGQPAIRLPAKLAGLALTRGLLLSDQKGSLVASDALPHWLRRMDGARGSAVEAQTPFAAQHWVLEEREIFDVDGDLIVVQANVAESPLLWLYRQRDAAGDRFLSGAEFAAGEKFRRDYAASAMGRMAASNWSAVRQGGSARRSASADGGMLSGSLDARRRVMQALAALGPVLDRVVFSMLVREQGISALERGHHWPKRSGKVVLKIALTHLVHHYGL